MDLKTDLNCLIECLRYRHDDPGKARDTILTIASLCSGSDEAQNFLRASGGLSFVVNLLSTAQDEGVRVATLYALGCATERNVFSQSRLCTEAMFQFLYCQLTGEQSGLQLKRTTTFLIMCLITNNGKGQWLVRKSKCLDALLQLFRQFPGLHLPYSPDTRCFEDEESQKLSLELWKDVAGTLCGCVNNPQNDENQLVCASSIPAALYIMTHSHDSHVLQLLCSFISLLAANNAMNQDRLQMLDGLDVIVSKLTSVIDAIVKEPEKGMISSASNMISMLSSVISDNENNLQALSSLKVVPLLLKLLSLEVITLEVKTKVIITLGCLVSANEGSKQQVVDCDGLKLLLSFMMANQDEECAKAATLVLHSCINSDSAVGDHEDREGKSSETKHGNEKEDQGEKHPLAKQQHHLESRIEILQETLEKERRLRKSLEDEKVSLQDSKDKSDGSIKKGEVKVTVNDQLLFPHPKTTVTSAEGHKTELQVSGRSDVSRQSSYSLAQLQERINSVEHKLQNITTTRSETDMGSDTTSSDSSDIESAEHLHRSVSEAEEEEARPSTVPKRKNFSKRYQTNVNPSVINQEHTAKDTHQLQITTSEKVQSKELPLLKVPQLGKRCRPLQFNHESSETKRSEKEDQIEECPLVKEQYCDFESRIDILQQALEKERRLRKSVQDEKVSLQDSKDKSNGSITRGEGKASADYRLRVPLSKTTVRNEEGQKTEQQVSGRSDVLMQSSHSFAQLQERMNTLEQKLHNITTIKSKTDMGSDTISSDSSDIESAENIHRSVSEAEEDEARPSSVPPRKNFNTQYRAKMNLLSMNQEHTGKDTNQVQKTTTEKELPEELPQFKVPPPVKRCRPLQLVHGKMSVNRMKSVTPKIKPLPPKKKKQEDRGEVTPPTKVQKVDLDDHRSIQESLDQSVHPGKSCGKRLRARRSNRHNVNRTLTYTSVGDHISTAQLSKEKQVNPESDSDADSGSSGTCSIADSVFSSLSEHLSCPIRPVKHSLPPLNCSPIRPIKHSLKVTMRPVKPSVHKPIVESRNVRNRTKKCRKESDPYAKANNVFDFEEDVHDCEKESSQRASSSKAFDHKVLSDDLVAKLKATPKVMLKKAPLKGHNMKMFTFNGKPQVDNLVLDSSRDKPESCQGVKDHPLNQQKHTSGSQRESTRIFTTKESGSKRKSYSVHYVRGKIQCSRLYRKNVSHGASGAFDASSSICPGCVPPQQRPLLDSRTLLKTLYAARYNLCRNHGRLVHSIAKYISKKTNLFGS